MAKKIIILIVSMCFGFFSAIGTCQSKLLEESEMQNNNIKNIDISVNIMPIKDSKYCYNFSTDSDGQIDYIVHMLDVMNFVDDGKMLGGADIPIVNINFKKTDGTIAKCGFVSGRFYDLTDKQYAADSKEYSRFLDFIYALKTEKLILPQNVSFEPSEWAKEEVDRASSMGLIPEWNSIGYADDITRLEVCQLADNFLTMNGMVRGIAKSQSFEDTRDPSVENLCSLGIIEGKTETEFYPYDYITREETAKILSGVCKAAGIEPEGRRVEYADYDRISDWAAEYVDEMSAIGAFIGDDRNSFNPQNNITKEEFVVILLRLSDKFI